MRFAWLFVLGACGGSDAAVTPDAPPPDAGPSGCPRTPAAEDRARFVVVSHPFDAQGGQSGMYEVLALSQAGELTRPNTTFAMGRASVGTIAFTPDGEVGLVALEDGKLGVFTLDAAGTPTVVNAGFAGSFYASRVVVEPRGDRAIVLDGNTRENGGGLYLVTIGCDGALTEQGMLAPAKLPGGLTFVGPRALLAAADVLDSQAGEDAFLLDWSDAPTRAAGIDAFGDDNAIVGGTALSFDDTTYLVGDVSQFSGVPNRVAIVGVDSGLHPKLSAKGTIDVEDPEAIAMSPFGNVAVVASAFGDALFVLDDGGAAGAWRVRGEVAYTGASAKLPGDVAAVDRGALRGHVLVSENVSVRHLAFGTDGTSVTDLGSLAFGSGTENISGAIGVTP